MALDAKALQEAREAAAVPVGVALDDDAGTVRRRRRSSSWNGGASPAPVPVPVPVVVLLRSDDDRKVKRELVAWAKAVASVAVRESMHCC
ncbi:hypothetical protein Zm00014a_013368 [Zea mays]|uniref:Uncharacterized protein n=1 Tax=Zea mays TaxID=4577 RepID=A0A3L6FRJ3_MAIZE|nr:hypothetical protein Zm00014a_013368 [Zea mays]